MLKTLLAQKFNTNCKLLEESIGKLCYLVANNCDI